MHNKLPTFLFYEGWVHASCLPSFPWRVSSLYLYLEAKWQVLIVWQIWFVKPLPRVCATLALPSNATQWNKYTLASVSAHISLIVQRILEPCANYSQSKRHMGRALLKNWDEAWSCGESWWRGILQEYKNTSAALVYSMGRKKCAHVWKVWSPWMGEQKTQVRLTVT